VEQEYEFIRIQGLDCNFFTIEGLHANLAFSRNLEIAFVFKINAPSLYTREPFGLWSMVDRQPWLAMVLPGVWPAAAPVDEGEN
jgi:hypothetical protein